MHICADIMSPNFFNYYEGRRMWQPVVFVGGLEIVTYQQN